MPKKKMLKKVSWEQFRKDGMVWFVNRFLHIFGYALVLEYHEDGTARTKYRGFEEDVDTRGFQNITKYMSKNTEQLLKDVG